MYRLKNPWISKPGYNCIGCAPDNPVGLHLHFYEDGDYVLTRWNPTQNHQGWVDTLHGGVQALLIDETSGWLISRKLQTTAVTSKMEIKYVKPVKTNEGEITVRAKISRQMRNVCFIDTEILDSTGAVCTEASLIFFCASPEQARENPMFATIEREEE